MPTNRLTFNVTTTSKIDFPDSDVVCDNGMTYVYVKGAKAFAVPTASVVAVEAISPAPATPDEPNA